MVFCGGAVALDLRRRALDPQQLGRQAEAAAVVEVDLQHLLVALQPDLDRMMAVAERPVMAARTRIARTAGRRAGSSSSGRASSTSMIGMPSRIG